MNENQDKNQIEVPFDQFNWEAIKGPITEGINLLKAFFTGPLGFMRSLPPSSWKSLLVVSILVSFASSVCVSVGLRSPFLFLESFFFWPLAAVFTVAITAALYFLLIYLINKEVNPDRLLALVVFSQIPMQVFGAFGIFFYGSVFVGIFLTGVLAVEGLVNGFEVSRNHAIKIVGIPLSLWTINQIWIWYTIGNAMNAISTAIPL